MTGRRQVPRSPAQPAATVVAPASARLLRDYLGVF